MNFAAYRKCPFLGKLLCFISLGGLLSRIHSSSAKKAFLKMGTSKLKKIPIFVPTMISEGRKSYTMEYIWKGVKILLKVYSPCTTANDIFTVFFCKANYLVP